MCNGSNQSPINIDTDNVTGADYRNFEFSIGYRFVQSGPLENDGHSCMAFNIFFYLSLSIRRLVFQCIILQMSQKGQAFLEDL